MKNILCIVAFAVLLTGCVMPQQSKVAPLPTVMVFPASKDVVWPLLIAQIGLDYPVKVVEKSSGLITTDLVNIPVSYDNQNMNDWVNPPSVFFGTWDGLRVTLSALVVETDPGKTQVTIRAHYEAFENNVYKQWLECESNGRLENQILTKIQNQLSPKSP